MQKPVLYLMLGYPGAGKTTAAKIISELTGAVHLWADKVRRKRYGTPTHSRQENLDLYGYLNDVAEQLLAKGESVVYDTNFNFYHDREHLRAIAAKHGATSHIIWVTTPKAIAKERATVTSHNQATRVFGNMPIRDFERISNNMEAPKPDEPVLTVDGTRIAPDYIKRLLDA